MLSPIQLHRATWADAARDTALREGVTARRQQISTMKLLSKKAAYLHFCAPSATRTRDLLLRRQLLYPLSYRGQPGQGDNLLAAAKPNRSAAIPRWPMRGAVLQAFPVPAGLRRWAGTISRGARRAA
jgi:hypothetical protein